MGNFRLPIISHRKVRGVVFVHVALREDGRREAVDAYRENDERAGGQAEIGTV